MHSQSQNLFLISICQVFLGHYNTAFSSPLFLHTFPTTALSLGSLHTFETIQDKGAFQIYRKIAEAEAYGVHLLVLKNAKLANEEPIATSTSSISLNASPRTVQNYFFLSNILHIFLIMQLTNFYSIQHYIWYIWANSYLDLIVNCNTFNESNTYNMQMNKLSHLLLSLEFFLYK